MKKVLPIIILVIIAVVVIILISNNKKKIEITKENFKYLYFSYSSGTYMNSGVSYEIENGKIYIKPDGISIDERIEKDLTDEELNTIINVINNNEVNKWNGFNKVDKNVLDGDSFTFIVRTTTDEELRAHGYEHYPKNYSIIKGEFYNLYSEYLEGAYNDN